MGDLLFLYTRSVKNGMLRMLKKPASLIGYLLLIALFGFNIFNTTRNLDNSGSGPMGKLIYLGIVLILCVFAVLQPIYNGTKRFSIKYLPADGVYLMSAPIKPLKVLWYGQLKQSISIILVSIMMVIQIPALIESAGLDGSGILLFLFGFFIMTLVPNVFSLFTFTLGLKYEFSKKITKVATIVIGAASILLIVFNLLSEEPIMDRLYNGITSPLWAYIPIVGWIFMIFISSVTGEIGLTVFVCISINVILVIGAFVMINKMANHEFYEEALNTANKIEKMRQGMKSGKSQMEAAMSTKKVKVKKIKSPFKREGVFALFDKQLLITRKKGISFLNLNSLIVIGAINAAMLFVSRINENDFAILVSFGVVSYALFFVQLMSHASDDLDRPYVYLFPYNAFQKLAALSLWGYIKITIDGLIGYGIASFYTDYSLLECILAGIFIGLVGYGFNMISILANIVFGKTGTMVLRMFMKISLDLMLVAIVVLIMVISLGGDIDNKLSLGIIFSILSLIGINALLMIPASFIVNKPEFNQ